MKKMKLQTMVGLVLALSFGIAYAAGVPIHIDADKALAFGLLGRWACSTRPPCSMSNVSKRRR